MVVRQSRRQAKLNAAKRRRGRAPLADRYPRGMRVQVTADFSDARYAEKIGTVVSTVETPDDSTYPFGRVEVRLVWHELQHKLFGGSPPKTVWIKPNYLEKLDA